MRADVAEHVVGMYDRLGFEQHGRGGDSCQRVEGLDDLVGLGLVLAIRAHALPDKRDRVQAQDLDAGVGDAEHLLGHGAEHRRVGVVQIPLEAVEGRPDPLAHILAPGEAAAPHSREDIAQRLLVGIRQRAVGEQEVVALVLHVAGLGAARPIVLVGGVIEDGIEHQADAVRLELARQRRQLLDCPELRVDAPVAADSVAAVAVAGGRLEQRHQVQVGQPKLLEVG